MDITDLHISAGYNLQAFERYIVDNRTLNRRVPTIFQIGCIGRDGKVMGAPNCSVKKVDEELARLIQGSLIFCAGDRHLDMTDFRNIVDHLRWSYYIQFDINGIVEAPTVEGVKVSCYGDSVFCHRPAYEPFEVSVKDLEDSTPLMTVPVTDVIGIPMAVAPSPLALPWRGRHSIHYDHAAHNLRFSLLNPNFIGGCVGTPVLARKDRKPLHVAHVHALVGYCQMVGARLHTETVPQNAAVYKTRAQHLLTHASRDDFAEFYRQWLGKEQNRQYRGVLSPYEI
ncbi:hypothetical protein BU26DRAFT_211098 [Trematosphaeria pertusa]|uniref:Uncharacterized protein n=1 Tax=Trematosphaeria pertusa TaxID=390896 RepID=A0A6A6IS35_9PLEO|nr:uncharacterized protein BU26DRAFT_211098 [Trematosphaeria pertusa]KAF2252888.1 hypothetical protein BU26DRAFT_211098 [Trematosphaeria pertusa]